MATILVVDDEVAIASALATFLERSGGHTVVRAHSAAEGVEAFGRIAPDLVLLDMALPDGSGLDVLEKLRGEDPVVIVVTGTADVTLAVEAMQRGAENFLTKPIELPHLGVAVERALEKSRLRKVSRYVSRRREGAPALLGSSPTMRELAEQVALLASSDRTTVLILGESGTGKQRVAESIHAHSPRAAKPFVEVNCAAMTPARLDLELFGRERVDGEALLSDDGGARGGLIEVANGGTLFLDEIGDLDLQLQPKVLRVLEGKGYRRLGGTAEVNVDVRLVAATNKDLVNEVTAGTFREDLYYRLSVMPLYLPPLRARSREDVAELVGSIVDELHAQLPEAPRRVAGEALDRMLKYAWPGNVRELRNVLERSMIMARGLDRIGPEHLPPEVRDASGGGVERHIPRTLSEVERAHIERTLRAHDGNRTHAAKELGISRATLIKKIKEFGLRI